MLSFDEFVTVKGKNAGYKKEYLCRQLSVSSERLRKPGKISLDEIRKIRDVLNIPQWEIEKYVLAILRDGDEKR